MPKMMKCPDSGFPGPQGIDVQEDDDLRPLTVKLKGTTSAVASIDERWEEEEPATEWRSTPMTRIYYTVTLEDDRQLTISRNMTYDRWYWAA